MTVSDNPITTISTSQENNTESNTTILNMNTTNTTTEIKNICFNAISELIDKYDGNSIALERIQKICVELLQHSVASHVSHHSDREEKLTKLKERSDSFINSFLDASPEYFYFQNNMFVEYDGDKYAFTSEDKISNLVVGSLSHDPELSCRKHKLKTAVIKKIRARGTSQAVPSSQTIQNVLQPLYPSVFETRNETKYFLTILGDVLTKKQSDLTYFAHHRAKEFVDYIISGLTYLKASSATALTGLFKYKFQNHSYNTTRIIRIQGEGDTLYYPNINILDLFFVAQYYSNRYGSADELLLQPNFASVANHAMVISRLGTERKVVEWFAREALVVTNQNIINKSQQVMTTSENVNDSTSASGPGSPLLTSSTIESIDVKTIQYMWKRFCQKMKIPNVVSGNILVPILLENETFSSIYDTEHKTFRGVIGNPQYNPSAGLFLEFWKDTMTVITENSQTTSDGLIDIDDFNQLEIDEISTLFNSWVRKKGCTGLRSGVAMLDEDEMLSCIKHFFPLVSVEEDKYVEGVTCSLWDKKQDVFDFIESQVGLTTDVTPRAPDFLYRIYCNNTLRTSICVASKGYFERAYNYIV